MTDPTPDVPTLRRLLAEADLNLPWKWERVTVPAGFETVAVYTPKDESVFEDRYIRNDTAALIVAAVNALPGILDRLEAAERAVARVEALAREWEADYPSSLASCNREVDEWWLDLRALLAEVTP